MAADIEKWFCSELVKFGIPATEDNARYILSMEDDNDLEEYMNGLLDTSDPNVRVFLQELRARCGRGSQSNGNIKIYQKETGEISQPKTSKKKKSRDSPNSNQSSTASSQPLSNGTFKEMSAALSDIQESSTPFSQSTELNSSGEIGVGAKKKTKFVPLYSKEGQAKTVIQLPGRHTCECQAAKHNLINNCINCGRIVCEQEGAGPCVFCGTLVCTPADQEVIDRGSKKGEKLRQFLMKGGSQGSGNTEDSSHSLLPHSSSQSKQGMEKALKHRDKLLEFDRTSVRRTQVIDDECDYYSTDTNQWLSKEDREKLRKREEELRKARHGSRRDRKITFDFAGRRVIDDEDVTAKNMYSMQDKVVQQVHYGKSDAGKYSASTVNPTIQLEPPKFDESVSSQSHQRNSPGSNFTPAKAATSRIQDKELQEMSDEGMCLSMHQPWASLLVTGIKMHEGRTWYTAHRGRLWIASTAKAPSTEEIGELETMYRHIRNDPHLTFPQEYPTACLLGCVNVDDCLSQEEYREQYPDGESASQYVFICSNPQQLIVKFPIKGKHKIYKLDQHIHQAAKKGLR